MTHEEVKKTGAAAKYLHGELSENEREKFEEHLFDCPECSGIVKADLILKTRGELSQTQGWAEEEKEEERGGLRLGGILTKWTVAYPRALAATALVAASLCIILALYQLLLIQGLRQKIASLSEPRPLASLPLHRTTRSDGQIVKVPQDCLSVSLWLQLSPKEDFPAYWIEVVGESTSFEVSLEPPKDYVLRLLVSCSDLPPGNYTLNLYGILQGERVWIDRIRFEASRE